MFGRRTNNGFTAMEALLTVAVAAVLLGTMVFVVNPAGQLREARDAQRRADVVTILNAVTGYANDNNGRLPFGITAAPTPICRSGVNLDCRGLINLNALTGAYLPAIPADPKDGTSVSTAYTVYWSGNRITITAPSTEEGTMIVAAKVLEMKKS